jgi:uncharacterized membrane protein YbaN (DUF454 family)
MGVNVAATSPTNRNIRTGFVEKASNANSAKPEVELDERAGAIRFHDTRLINKGRRAFCRRLVDSVARRPGVKKTVVDLAAASCRVEFAPGKTTCHTMADILSSSIREASVSVIEGDGTPWWQPSTIWLTLTAYPFAGDVSLWETLEAKPGQVRVRHQGLSGDYEGLSEVADTLASLDRVESCRAGPWSHRLTIDYRPDNGVPDWFLDQAERVFEELRTADMRQLDRATTLAESEHSSGRTEVATGTERWMYYALAAGGLVMTVVGLIMPGIPTLPFLLASSYGFARSSPRMNQWLRRTRFFGPILSEWEQYGGMSRSSKEKLVGLTLVIIVVAVILAPLSPLGFVLILIMSSLSIYGLYQLPTIAAEPSSVAPSETPARLAPTAP